MSVIARRADAPSVLLPIMFVATCWVDGVEARYEAAWRLRALPTHADVWRDDGDGAADLLRMAPSDPDGAHPGRSLLLSRVDASEDLRRWQVDGIRYPPSAMQGSMIHIFLERLLRGEEVTSVPVSHDGMLHEQALALRYRLADAGELERIALHGCNNHLRVLPRLGLRWPHGLARSSEAWRPWPRQGPLVV